MNTRVKTGSCRSQLGSSPGTYPLRYHVAAECPEKRAWGCFGLGIPVRTCSRGASPGESGLRPVGPPPPQAMFVPPPRVRGRTYLLTIPGFVSEDPRLGTTDEPRTRHEKHRIGGRSLPTSPARNAGSLWRRPRETTTGAGALVPARELPGWDREPPGWDRQLPDRPKTNVQRKPELRMKSAPRSSPAKWIKRDWKGLQKRHIPRSIARPRFARSGEGHRHRTPKGAGPWRGCPRRPRGASPSGPGRCGRRGRVWTVRAHASMRPSVHSGKPLLKRLV